MERIQPRERGSAVTMTTNTTTVLPGATSNPVSPRPEDALAAAVFPSLDVDPVTGLDPVLYTGAVSPSKTRFQRKPPLVDRRREYAQHKSHQFVATTVDTITDHHARRQVEQEEAFDRDNHANQFRTHFIETRLATCGIPTLNTMDVLIRRERQAATVKTRAEAEANATAGVPQSLAVGKPGKPQKRSTSERVQDAIREAYGSRTLDLKALELVHIPREVFSTLLLQLGRFITCVNISRNSLREVPNTFVDAFRQVAVLNYKENALDVLPTAIQSLAFLTDLNAECNQLRTLGAPLPSSLTRLVLSRNRLRTLPNAHDLSNLVELDLAHNFLELLPPGVTHLGNLQTLTLTSNRIVTLALQPVFTQRADEGRDHAVVATNAATMTIEEEKKLWRVENDPEANHSAVYFHTVTREVTRIPPSCFRAPVPMLPIGKSAQVTQQRKRDEPWLAQFPDGWEITLGGRCINLLSTLSGGNGSMPSTPATAPPHTAASGGSLQSMKLEFMHHPTEQRFTEIPAAMDKWGELHRIHALHLSGNQLRDLPPSIGKLVRLRRLEVENNRLLTLPDTFQDMNKLECVRLGMNRLMELPPSFYQLCSLTDLDLKLNRFERFPDAIGELQRLSVLDLSSNALEMLPSGFLRLKKLTTLRLQNNHALVRMGGFTTEAVTNGDIAQVVWQLKHQLLCEERGGGAPVPESRVIGVGEEVWSTQLHLQREFAAAVTRAQQTHVLDFHWKHLTIDQFPATFFTSLASLQELRLSGHTLTEIPATFSYLSALRVLHLRKNKIQCIDDTIFSYDPPIVSRLCELDLEYNQLVHLPASIGSLTQLRVLRAGNNQIEALPESIYQLTQLTSLHLAHNHMKQPSSALGSLVALELLDLSYNQLQTLDSMAFQELARLKVVRVNMNELVDLPRSLASAPIRELYVAGNRFTTLPDTILLLRDSLHVLQMQSNKIFRLPVEFGELCHLEVIESDGNPFRSPPPEIMKLGIHAIRAYLIKRFERVREITKLLDTARLPCDPEAFLQPTLVQLIIRPPNWSMNQRSARMQTPSADQRPATSSSTALSSRDNSSIRLLASPNSSINSRPTTAAGSSLVSLKTRTPLTVDPDTDRWRGMQFLCEKHLVSFERAVDRYVNGAFYLLSPDLRGADLVNTMLLQKQFFLAQTHREQVVRDLVRLCELVHRKRWLDKVDFRYDLERPWGRLGELVGVYSINPRALFDDHNELPSVLSVIRTRVYHGFEEEAFEHDEATVVDAISHFVGVFGPVGLVHDEVPFKCACEELLRVHKQHVPCFRSGWSIVQVVYTPEEADRRVRDEQTIRDALLALRPQVATFLATQDGEKRFHGEVAKIKLRLRGEIKQDKPELKKLIARYEKRRKALNRVKKKEQKAKQREVKSPGEIEAREKEEAQLLRLQDRVETCQREMNAKLTKLSQGFQAFQEDVISILLESVSVEVQNRLLRQQRQRAIELNLRRPWDGPSGRDFEAFKKRIRRQMQANGTMQSEEKDGGKGKVEGEEDGGDAEQKKKNDGDDDDGTRSDDNSEVSDISFDGYEDLVSNLAADARARERANGTDNEDTEGNEDGDDGGGDGESEDEDEDEEHDDDEENGAFDENS